MDSQSPRATWQEMHAKASKQYQDALYRIRSFKHDFSPRSEQDWELESKAFKNALTHLIFIENAEPLFTDKANGDSSD
jgi:hypothetical protein